MNLHQLNLSADRLRQIEELLKDDPALREQLLPTSESATERAFRVVSIVRAFDRPMYDEVCRLEDPTLPAFDDIVGSSDVQHVPRAEGQFWLRDVVQNYWLSYWDKHPDEYAKWAQLFVGWLQRNNKDPAEQLALLLRFDHARALQFLTTTFKAADATDDLTLCHSLTQQVEANLSKIAPDLRPAFAGFVARYRGRAWFLREFHRTIKYFPRRAAEEDFHKIVNGSGSQWIFYLSAQGGMGKTIFVQRMIAHDLLKTAPFPLVARIDLDDIEVPELAKAPWLAAIEVAEELDEQLTQPLFSEGSSGFLSDVKMFGPLLYRRDSNRGRTLTDDERYKLRSLAAEQFAHWSRFVGRCLNLPRDRPLVVFIDTIEEATLHWPGEFRQLLARFEELRMAVPQLRLILSGRYAPTGQDKQFDQYDEKLKKQTRFIELAPLEDPEAGDFIRHLLPETGKPLVDKMIDAAAGNPFKLSMLCEIVEQNPEMTAEELEKLGPDVDVAYLIKRVVERIPIQNELGLRWLLRYGALPRRLTLTFVKEVLHPLLIDALSGKIEEAKEDVPSETEREAWLKNADVALNPDHLWTQLSKYASDHSWISLQSKDPYTATLHPDVSKPMRRLIKTQRIFRRIHQEALSHVDRLKKEHPDRWVDLTLAELFHRIELGEAQIEEKLVAALDERASPDDVALRLEVLREIVKPDGDFSGAPRAALARAHYEIADATAIAANFEYLPQGARRDDIGKSLEKAFELNRTADVPLPPFAFEWRDFLDRNIPGTWSAVANLLGTERGESRTRYWLLIVEMLAERKLPSLVFSLLAAFSDMSGWEIASKRIPGWVVLERAAIAYKRRGDTGSAERRLREILDSWKDARKGTHFDRIQTSLIELLVSNLRLRDAEKEMQKAGAAADDQYQERLAIRIEICLLRRDAWAALALTERLEKSHYNFHWMRGRALGQLLRIDDAISAFAAAAQGALKSATPTVLDDIRRDELRFRLFEAGLPTEPDAPRSSPVGAAAELELIRAFQLRDKPEVCEGIVETLNSERNPEPIRIRTTIAAVTWGILPSSAIDDSFTTMLSRAGHTGLRLRLMDPPVLLGPSGPWKCGWYRRWTLRTYLGPAGETETMDWIRYGRVLLAMGDRTRADEAFAQANIEPGAGKEKLALFRQRCLGDAEAPCQPVAFWSGLASEPPLHAAALMENAERAMHHAELTIAQESLVAAETALQSESIHPVLVERHRGLQARLATLQTAAAPALESAADVPTAQVAGNAVSSLADHPVALIAIEAERISIERPGHDRRLLSTEENQSLRILSAYSRERTPKRLVPHFMKTWPEPVEELREPLEDLLQGAKDGGGPVLLALAGPSLVAVPWEVAIPPSFVPVRIGNGRHDGGTMAEAIRRPINTGPSVKVLSGLPWRRPDQSSGGFGICPALLLGSTTATITQSVVFNERLLASGLFSNDPATADVIYILSDIEDSPSLPEPCLPGGRTGEQFGRELARGRKENDKPFIVLHCPTLPSSSGATEQLFARNRLAQALVNSGAVAGVLATGLTSSPHDPGPQDLLLESLRTATDAFDVMRRLRAAKTYPNAGASLEETLGLPATALFLDIDYGLAP